MTAHRKNSTSNNDSKRIAANMKERERVQRMNKAFVDLKKVLPRTASATKMDLLSSAKDHIQVLTEVLQEACGKDIKSILNEHKLRKICGIRASQLTPYKKIPETIFQFSVQSPKSAIPFQDEASSITDFMNPESATNDWLFLSPPPLNCQSITSQVLPHEGPSETVFKFAVQSPKSTIPLQNETASIPNFVSQGQVTGDLGLIIGPPLCNSQNHTQESVNPQNLMQPYVKPETWNPEGVIFPHHRVTNGESMSYSTKGLGLPSMTCVTLCNSSNSQDINQINSRPVFQPTLLDELDQFCCEVFDMMPPGDKA